MKEKAATTYMMEQVDAAVARQKENLKARMRDVADLYFVLSTRLPSHINSMSDPVLSALHAMKVALLPGDSDTTYEEFSEAADAILGRYCVAATRAVTRAAKGRPVKSEVFAHGVTYAQIHAAVKNIVRPPPPPPPSSPPSLPSPPLMETEAAGMEMGASSAVDATVMNSSDGWEAEFFLDLEASAAAALDVDEDEDAERGKDMAGAEDPAEPAIDTAAAEPAGKMMAQLQTLQEMVVQEMPPVASVAPAEGPMPTDATMAPMAPPAAVPMPEVVSSFDGFIPAHKGKARKKSSFKRRSAMMSTTEGL
ncbi:hypothetical protein DFJ73DRAFT_401938 [Zopfochytrium polystomum]|nr:hypothetical protein DFJ73DRAFT_401938 [Zopfochytrium polystomum]